MKIKLLVIAVVAFLALFSSEVFAGDEFSHQDTLINDSTNLTNGYFVSPEAKFTRVVGGFGLLLGGRAAWLVNHSYAIGLGGYGLVTNNKHPDDGSTFYNGTKLGMGYGGAFFEYLYPPSKVVHLSASLLLGGGAAGFYNTGSTPTDNYALNVFFVAEPTVAIEINVVSYFRITIGGGYRFTSAFNAGHLSSSDISGPTATLMLKFGSF